MILQLGLFFVATVISRSFVSCEFNPDYSKPHYEKESPASEYLKELQVVVLVGEDEGDSEWSFLQTACQLGYTSPKVVRGWCPSDDCGGAQILEDHLANLPHDATAIIVDLREGYRYLMTRSSDALDSLKTSDKKLILAPHLSKHKDFFAAVENEGKKGRDQSHVSNNFKEMQNEVSEEKEDLKTEKIESKLNRSLLKLVLDGGAALGQVGLLYKALQGKNQVLEGASVDNMADYVLFVELQSGALGMDSSSRPIFIPQGDIEENAKHPMMIINDKADNVNIYNTIQAMVKHSTDSCPFHTLDSGDDESASNAGRVALVMTVGWPITPFFEEVLQGLADQDYSKNLIYLTFSTKNTSEIPELNNFFGDYRSAYGSMRIQEDVSDANIKTVCDEVGCTAVVIMSTIALLTDSNTLTRLMKSTRPLVAPLLASTGTDVSYNYNYSEEEGVTSPVDQLLKDRDIRALAKVAGVKEFVVVRRDAIDDIGEGVMVSSFLDTRHVAGQLVDPRQIPTGKLYPSIWSPSHNPGLWKKRYVHPELFDITKRKEQPRKVDKYLYYIPYLSERFCKEFIDELENFSKWNEQIGDYLGTTSINLENEMDTMDMVDFLLNFVNVKIINLLYNDFKSSATSNYVFVNKYRADRDDYGTYNYHLDGGSYTFNIALNNNFTGGGVQYKLGNPNWNETYEFKLDHTRIGWAVVQPNRPLSIHRGVTLETGIRYAMILIIETNDEFAKGGPV